MANFAEINSENLVLRVLVADDADCINHGGHGSEEAANRFNKLCNLSTNGVKWVETFTDGTRGQHAGIGKTWNEEHQIFCESQNYPSWTLNTTTGAYEAPVAFPNLVQDGKDKQPSWNEENQRWEHLNCDEDPAVTEIWDPNTSTWS
tara:strand:+ start:788 stop:1228 length:441 start_codon:yes stop_codon:yes gene_type:complete